MQFFKINQEDVMLTRVCFKHNKKNEGNGWVDEPQMSIYMLWIKKPVLCQACDKCAEEKNVRDTIQALREREET